MKFKLISLETWPYERDDISLAYYTRDGIDGSSPGAAAKKISELGGRGQCVLEDSQGTRTTWTLHAITVHYAYPVLEPV